jgi:hypothetical protein
MRPFAKIKITTITLSLLLMIPLNAPAAPPFFPGGLIIDHTSVAAFESIPAVWLEQAKSLTLHYAHTSHGSQIVSGILALEAVDSTYSVAVRESGTEGLPSVENPVALRIYDGNPPETYIEPGDYWDGTSAMNRTRAVAGTGHYNFSMWSWCGQQSGNDTTTVNRYLSNLATLETEYPDMRFILMTGHTDGSDTPLEEGTLKFNNELVRQYARDNNKIVFDFADIESWDPAGNHYATTTDACGWCTTWCTNHPTDCLNLVPNGSCAHTHSYICKLKAKGFWYMMARLAGWDGASTCENLPARISEIPNDYTSIEKAYAAATTGQTILLQEKSFNEALNISADSVITVKGGYACDYSSITGFSAITGNMTVTAGTAIVENLIIK